MRQLLIAGSVAYPTSAADLTKVAAGAIGFFVDKNGVATLSADGSDITNRAMLVLGRSAQDGGPVVLPIYKNRFSFVKGTYQGATTFKASFTVAAPTRVGDYTVVVVKKGLKFNERSNFSAMVYVDDVTMTANDLAQKIADSINAMGINSGVKATVSTATVTIDANEAAQDYEIVMSDNMYGTDVTYTTRGKKAYGDAQYVIDLANKAAADAGFEYTYYSTFDKLYPNYPVNPLKAADSADVGFTIFTLKFAEPREVRTVDEEINQIVQIAIPTGAGQITNIETILTALSK